jgi:hypothetical protein
MSSNQLSLYRFKDFLNENANISARNRIEMCELAHSFREEKLLIFIVFLSTLLGLINLIVLFLVFKNNEVRRIFSLLHLDLKFLLVLGFANYTISSFNSLAFFGYKTTSLLLIDLPPCYYIMNGYACFYSQSLLASICPQVRVPKNLQKITLIWRVFLQVFRHSTSDSLLRIFCDVC